MVGHFALTGEPGFLPRNAGSIPASTFLDFRMVPIKPERLQIIGLPAKASRKGTPDCEADIREGIAPPKLAFSLSILG